ncbi:hypothetical protein [Streptomyces sp. KHY 26]|uniref:hypothetical protein n=1 Tax=Streptomyces sp. KHY 26 TaxID=3097359 RepID=UPI00376F065E
MRGCPGPRTGGHAVLLKRAPFRTVRTATSEVPLRSLRPCAAGAVALLAFSAAAPAAHAAHAAPAVPVAHAADCDKALAAAQKAERDDDDLKADLLRSVADGGHPDASQRQAAQQAESLRDSTAVEAEHVCAGAS